MGGFQYFLHIPHAWRSIMVVVTVHGGKTVAVAAPTSAAVGFGILAASRIVDVAVGMVRTRVYHAKSKTATSECRAGPIVVMVGFGTPFRKGSSHIIDTTTLSRGHGSSSSS